MLAELAENEPLSFQSVVAHVQPTVAESPRHKALEDLGYKGMHLGAFSPTMDPAIRGRLKNSSGIRPKTDDAISEQQSSVEQKNM